MRRGKKILLFLGMFSEWLFFLGTVTEVSAASDRSAEEEEQEKQNEQEISLEEGAAENPDCAFGGIWSLDRCRRQSMNFWERRAFRFGKFWFRLSEKADFFKEGAKEIISASLSSHLSLQKKTLVEILLLVLLAALFANFSSAFGKGQTGEVSFYVVYLFLLVLLLRSFGNMGTELTTESLKGLVFFTKALIPSYFLAVTAATGSVSAMVFYEMVFLVIYLVQTVLLKVILPGIEAYVLISMVNFLQKEDLLSRMAELFKTLLEWGLNACTAVVIGMQVIQNMISPAVDTLKRDMLGKAAAALPGIGNAIDGVTEVALGTAVLIRNSLGVLEIPCFLFRPCSSFASGAFHPSV